MIAANAKKGSDPFFTAKPKKGSEPFFNRP
jgi:hypothetical protein